MTNSDYGNFYGIGVGPGDPELLTLKAQRLIQNCDVLAFLANREGISMARAIASNEIESAKPGMIELPVIMPMCDSREIANGVYDAASLAITAHLRKGREVGFLCQGDPFFFGSFSYLHDRLSDEFNTIVVPGITSINASASLMSQPLALLAENFAVISGRRSDKDILQTLQNFDNVAIMKPGKRRPAILDLLKKSNRTDDARYIEYAGQAEQRIVEDISTLEDGEGPYFSVFLINRKRQYGTMESV